MTISVDAARLPNDCLSDEVYERQSGSAHLPRGASQRHRRWLSGENARRSRATITTSINYNYKLAGKSAVEEQNLD